jgi:hypothetical protein
MAISTGVGYSNGVNPLAYNAKNRARTHAGGGPQDQVSLGSNGHDPALDARTWRLAAQKPERTVNRQQRREADGRHVQRTKIHDPNLGKDYVATRVRYPNGLEMRHRDWTLNKPDFRRDVSETTTLEPGKKPSSQKTVHQFSRDQQARTERREMHQYKDGKRVSSVVDETSRVFGVDKNVDGVAASWSNNPQKLANRLGDQKDIKVFKTDRTSIDANLKQTRTEVLKWSNEKQKTELLRFQTNGGGKMWEFRQGKNLGGHEVKDSQVFIQGTNNTIKTTNSLENGFLVTRTDSDLSDSEQAKKNQMPAESHATLGSKERGRMRDLQQLVQTKGRPLSGLSSLQDSKAYKQFQQLAGNKPIKLAFSEDVRTFEDGRTIREARIVAESGGNRLILTRDPQTRSLAAHLRGNEGKETLSIQTGKEQLELSGPNLLKIPRDVAQRGADAWKATEGVQAMVKHGDKYVDAFQDSYQLSKWSRPLQGVGVAVSAVSLGMNLAGGNMKDAGADAANLATDVAGVTEAAAGMRGPLSAVSKTAEWTTKAGRGLGIAGAIVSTGYGVHEIATGDKVKGTLDVLAGLGTGVGTAAAIAGPAWAAGSWAGPVGWGVAAVASVGALTYDNVKSTEIAPLGI